MLEEEEEEEEEEKENSLRIGFVESSRITQSLEVRGLIFHFIIVRVW